LEVVERTMTKLAEGFGGRNEGRKGKREMVWERGKILHQTPHKKRKEEGMDEVIEGYLKKIHEHSHSSNELKQLFWMEEEVREEW
jgi:hypothetical protein